MAYLLTLWTSSSVWFLSYRSYLFPRNPGASPGPGGPANRVWHSPSSLTTIAEMFSWLRVLRITFPVMMSKFV